MHFAAKAIKSAMVIALLVVSIEAFMLLTRPSPAAFARPSEILIALPQFILGEDVRHVWSTVWRTGVAILLALPIGLGAGFLVAKVPWIRREGSMVIDFLRSIPATALVPVFFIIFGLGNSSKIAVGTFSGALVLSISVILGVRGLVPERAHVADRIGLKGLKRLFLYEAIEILPSVLLGIRTAASLCLVLVVVAEMFIGTESGLGRVIMDERYSDDVPKLYAAIVVSGLVGFALNQVLIWMDRIVRRRFIE